MLEPARRFYNDLSPADQAHWVSLLKPQHQHIPFTYLFCENDKTLSLGIQRGAVEGSEVKSAAETRDSGHNPFLNMPERMVEVIDRLAG